jgi:2-polyprenyl-3-methyl-5-hydroxy-6-metoxy-1,4-benzoquinol methylase
MSHVLEHVPNPSEILDLGLKLVRKGGYIVSFTPNGSMEHKKKIQIGQNYGAWFILILLMKNFMKNFLIIIFITLDQVNII